MYQKYKHKTQIVSKFCEIVFNNSEAGLFFVTLQGFGIRWANLSKQNVDVMLTSCQRHANVCKSILDVNASWSRWNFSKCGDVDAENGIFQKPKR